MSVFALDPKDQLLQRARAYVAAPESFVHDVEEGTRVLVRAMRHADPGLRDAIGLLIASFGDRSALVEPLYAIVRDPREAEDARRDAAIHLSVLAAHVDAPKDLAARLVADLEGDDARLRSCATLALGWSANRAAVLPLLGALHDEDERVRRAAIFALANVGDDRLLGVLLDRLSCAPRDEQRAVLENVWRFRGRSEEVAEAYLGFVDETDDDDLRYVAFLFFGLVATVEERAYEYAAFLRDHDERVRLAALRKLADLPAAELVTFERPIAGLLEDTSVDVERAALRALAKIASRRG